MAAEEIRTERLLLRRYRDEDAGPINALVQDPRIYRNVGRIPPNAPLDRTRDFIARATAGWEDGTALGFAVTLDGAIVGTVGGGAPAPGLPLDVCYWIAPDLWGRGYATEAFLAYLAWLGGARGHRCATAGYFPDNPASGRVLRKAGFLPCGRSRYTCLGREADIPCVDMVWLA